MSFHNKVIWITGASSGIGKALAQELSYQNALLIISARDKNSLEMVRGLCKNPKKCLDYSFRFRKTLNV